MLTYRLLKADETYTLRHEVMWPNMPIDFIKLPEDSSGIHYGLYHNNELATVVSLFVDGHEAQFRKLATDTSLQGNGYATALLKHVFEQARKLSINRIWCNARKEKANFYSRFGMCETSKSFIKKGQNYIIMECHL